MRRALLLAIVLAVPAQAEAAGMVRLPGGRIARLYAMAGDTTTRQRVESFRIDRDPVSRRDFLAFVRAHPAWRRSAVAAVYAQPGRYLADWADDLNPGSTTDLDLPVNWVSWHAAQAYCRERGLRLPTVAEWEYAAAASESARNASQDPHFVQQLATLYAQRTSPSAPPQRLRPNAWGIRGLHEYGWEWVDDFNSILASDDSRELGGRNVDAVCASASVGATDPANYPAFLRAAVRASLEGNSGLASLGFRCAGP